MDSIETEKIYLHGFNLLPQFGPARLTKLLNFFGSYHRAYFAKKESLLNAGLEEDVATAFLKHRELVNLQSEEQRLKKAGVKILTPSDPNFPKLLLEIPKSPPILYYRGEMTEAEELFLAVVGTRKITSYGRTIIPELLTPLVKSGITVVSGLAFGVDSLAHEISLSYGKRTIAVLGGGLDDSSLYPKHHQWLAKKILEGGGALISEYPLGTPSLKHHFISRNRIISGLAPATLIVECDLQSGSLITANHALEQNRTIFAVPGPIYSPQSRGPNNLIKMGAKAVTSAEDILEDLNLQALPSQQKIRQDFADSPAETAILKCLSQESLGINDLIKLSGLTTPEATSALTLLEMKGRVRNLGGQQYILGR